jgi:hypothetical protein
LNEQVEADTAFVANGGSDTNGSHPLSQHFLLLRKKLWQVKRPAVDGSVNIQEKLTVIGIGLGGYSLLE